VGRGGRAGARHASDGLDQLLELGEQSLPLLGVSHLEVLLEFLVSNDVQVVAFRTKVPEGFDVLT
jgi:hypothetical protein